MKTYKIFANPQGQQDAVKQGWSWPGYFFNIIWALVKKMWGLGIGLFILFFVLRDNDLAMGMGTIIAIIFGFNGNKWREKKLISRGFDYKNTVNANNPEAAIALWLKENKKLIE